MSHSKSSSPTDLMVLAETTAQDDLLGWVVGSCEHNLTIAIDDSDSPQDGWTVSVPWSDVLAVHDVTEFMTRRAPQAV